MNGVFLKLVEMSVGAIPFIAVVIVTRPLLDKLPKRFSMLIWAAVGLRLTLPVRLERSFRLFPASAPADTATAALFQSITSGQAYSQESNTLVNGGAELSALDTARYDSANIVHIAAVVWLCGCVIMTLYAAVSTAILRRRLSSAVVLRNNIRQSEYVPTAFVMGIFRPTIYLPFGVNERYAPLIIAHENTHISRGDHIIKPLGFLILSLHWFDPFVWAAYILMCRDIETACDERVAASLTFNERKVYAMAMLEFENKSFSNASAPVTFGEICVKSRVRRLLNYKRPAIWSICLSAVLCAVGVVCLMTVPKSTVLKSYPTLKGTLYRTGETFYNHPFSSTLGRPNAVCRFDLDSGYCVICNIDTENQLKVIPENKDFSAKLLTSQQFIQYIGSMADTTFDNNEKLSEWLQSDEVITEYTFDENTSVFSFGKELWLGEMRGDESMHGRIWSLTMLIPTEPENSITDIIRTAPAFAGNEPSKVLEVLNVLRAFDGLAAYLDGNESLYRAAQIRADECVSQYSHERPDGTSFSTALNETGVSYSYCDELIGVAQRNASQFAAEAYSSGKLGSRFDTIAVASSEAADGTTVWVIEAISEK